MHNGDTRPTSHTLEERASALAPSKISITTTGGAVRMPNGDEMLELAAEELQQRVMQRVANGLSAFPAGRSMHRSGLVRRSLASSSSGDGGAQIPEAMKMRTYPSRGTLGTRLG